MASKTRNKQLPLREREDYKLGAYHALNLVLQDLNNATSSQDIEKLRHTIMGKLAEIYSRM